jgi:hypothetical protein
MGHLVCSNVFRLLLAGGVRNYVLGLVTGHHLRALFSPFLIEVKKKVKFWPTLLWFGSLVC